jgi:hypothetical protein
MAAAPVTVSRRPGELPAGRHCCLVQRDDADLNLRPVELRIPEQVGQRVADGEGRGDMQAPDLSDGEQCSSLHFHAEHSFRLVPASLCDSFPGLASRGAAEAS